MKPCRFCKTPTDKRWSPDMDIEGIPLCGSEDCSIKLMIWLDEELAKRPKPKMSL